MSTFEHPVGTTYFTKLNASTSRAKEMWCLQETKSSKRIQSICLPPEARDQQVVQGNIFETASHGVFHWNKGSLSKSHKRRRRLGSFKRSWTRRRKPRLPSCRKKRRGKSESKCRFFKKTVAHLIVRMPRDTENYPCNTGWMKSETHSQKRRPHPFF